jgi:hypothetical protein
VNLGTVAAVFVDAANADHLTGEFFTFDHGAFPIRADMTEDCDESTLPSTSNAEGTFRITGAYHTHRV